MRGLLVLLLLGVCAALATPIQPPRDGRVEYGGEDHNYHRATPQHDVRPVVGLVLLAAGAMGAVYAGGWAVHLIRTRKDPSC